MRVRWFIPILLLLAVSAAAAEQSPGDLSGFLPANGEVSGWTQSDGSKNYRGDELFMMIDGGADIYHEYGFTQVLEAEYVDGKGKSIKLEIYEMESSAAAYGIYSFKSGDDGKVLAIGREALLEEYYLNFWKGNLQITVIGSDSEEETVQGVVAFARAVDGRLARTGERPGLAALLLREPLAFSHPKYVRGAIGVMNSYVFDREDIFRVREGLIGTVDDYRTFVFQYRNEGESTAVYEQATAQFSAGSRFKDGVRQGNHYSMIDRKHEFVLIRQTGEYIGIVIGQNQNKAKAVLEQLMEKLKNV